MVDIIVTWEKCSVGKWYSFKDLNLDQKPFNNLKGVYIIWNNETVVKIGSGILKEQINTHKNDSEILIYPNLKVTWAKLHAKRMGGVEKYLTEILYPDIRKGQQVKKSISVNLPW